jgi:hypothetical protein
MTRMHGEIRWTSENFESSNRWIFKSSNLQIFENKNKYYSWNHIKMIKNLDFEIEELAVILIIIFVLESWIIIMNDYHEWLSWMIIRNDYYECYHPEEKAKLNSKLSSLYRYNFYESIRWFHECVYDDHRWQQWPFAMWRKSRFKVLMF